MLSADYLDKQFGRRSGLTKKVNFEKASRRQQKHEKLLSMQRVKEGFDTFSLRKIRRRAVKCSGDTAQLVRIICVFFGYSCNKYLILMGKFVSKD